MCVNQDAGSPTSAGTPRVHRYRSICRGEVTLGEAVARVSVWVDILRRLGLLVVEYRGPHDQEFSFARCQCWDHQFLEWISLRGRSRAGWELARQRLARWAEWRGSDDCSKADSRKSMPTELLKCQMRADGLLIVLHRAIPPIGWTCNFPVATGTSKVLRLRRWRYLQPTMLRH